MPKPEKPALLKWLYRIDGHGVFSLRDVLQVGAEIVLKKSTMEAEGYAEANLNTFWNYVLTAQDEDERRGIRRVLTIADSAARMLKWYAPRPGDNQKCIHDLARLRHRPAFLKMIDALTSREYEALACVAMKLIGASEVELTPGGTEGGVDFFALLLPPAHCHLFAGSTNPVRIIGQSKKYTSPVGVDKFKEFLTTITEVKHRGEPKTERVIPTWFQTVRGPIVGCMIAHSGFQSGSMTRARNHGIITADSLDVAEMLALSRGIPEHLNGPARATEASPGLGSSSNSAMLRL
jgi:Restriction endonuclease